MVPYAPATPVPSTSDLESIVFRPCTAQPLSAGPCSPGELCHAPPATRTDALEQRSSPSVAARVCVCECVCTCGCVLMCA